MRENPLKEVILVLCLLMWLSLVVYLPWHWVLVLDDLPDIVNNSALRLSPIDVFLKNPFRFLTYLTYWFDLSLPIEPSKVLHITNIFLHCAVCFLFTIVLLRLRSQMEKAILPLVVFLFMNSFMWSSVLYVSARSAILATAGCLITVHGLLGFLRDGKIREFVEMSIGILVAIFSKESAVVLPFMLLPLRSFDRDKRFWKAWVPLFVFATGYAFFRLMHPVDLGEGAVGGYTPLQYLLTQVTIVPLYLLKFFFALHPGLEWDVQVVRDFWNVCFIVNAVFLISLFVIFWKVTSGNIVARFFLGWIPLSLAVESSIIPLGDLAFDHRFYMTGVGVTALMGVFFEPLAKSKMKISWLLTFLLILMIMSFFTYGYARSKRWKSVVGVWEEAVRSSPFSFRARYNLGHNLLEEGKVLKAFPHLNYAVKIEGRSPGETAYALNARGLALLKMGRLDDAQNDFNGALQVAPNFGDAMLHLGVTYFLEGEFAKALEILQRAQELLPGDPKVAKALEKVRHSYDLLHSPGGR